MLIRPPLSPRIANRKPSPSPPSRFSAGHEHLVEDDLTGGLRAPPHLRLVRTERQARRALLHDERRDAVRALVARARHHDVDVGRAGAGDELLDAGQGVTVVGADRPGGQVARRRSRRPARSGSSCRGAPSNTARAATARAARQSRRRRSSSRPCCGSTGTPRSSGSRSTAPRRSAPRRSGSAPNRRAPRRCRSRPVRDRRRGGGCRPGSTSPHPTAVRAGRSPGRRSRGRPRRWPAGRRSARTSALRRSGGPRTRDGFDSGSDTRTSYYRDDGRDGIALPVPVVAADYDRAALRSRAVPRRQVRRRCRRRRGAAPHHRARPSHRGAGLPAFLGGRAPQHAGHRELVAGRAVGPPGRRTPAPSRSAPAG